MCGQTDGDDECSVPIAFRFMERRTSNDTVMTVVLRNAYWGEYPLSFAACLGQEECVRLLCAKDVDVNRQDTNGNTALHMVVIHEQQVHHSRHTHARTHARTHAHTHTQLQHPAVV